MTRFITPALRARYAIEGGIILAACIATGYATAVLVAVALL